MSTNFFLSLLVCLFSTLLTAAQDSDKNYSYGYYVLDEDSIKFRKEVLEYGLWDFRFERDVKLGERALSGVFEPEEGIDLYKEETAIWENHSDTDPDSLNMVKTVYPFRLKYEDYSAPNSRLAFTRSDILAQDIKVSELFRIGSFHLENETVITQLTIVENSVEIITIRQEDDKKRLRLKRITYDLTISGDGKNFSQSEYRINKANSYRLLYLEESLNYSESTPCTFSTDFTVIMTPEMRYFYSLECSDANVFYPRVQHLSAQLLERIRRKFKNKKVR